MVKVHKPVYLDRLTTIYRCYNEVRKNYVGTSEDQMKAILCMLHMRNTASDKYLSLILTAFDALIVQIIFKLPFEVYASYHQLKALTDIRPVKEIIESKLLKDKNLCMNDRHGLIWPFGKRSAEENKAFMQYGIDVINDIREITENVCFCTGTVLGIVRENGFMPQDDDIDVLACFDQERIGKISKGKDILLEHLLKKKHVLSFCRQAHFRLLWKKYENVHICLDVFSGIIEGQYIAHRPIKRRSLLADDVFPCSTATVYGLECTLPKNPERYLEAVYGPNWRIPGHASWDWSSPEYDDIM